MDRRQSQITRYKIEQSIQQLFQIYDDVKLGF